MHWKNNNWASRFIRLVLLDWILSITIGRIVPLQGMHGVLDSPHVSSLRVDDEVNKVCDTCHTVSFLIVPLPHSNRRPACRDRISKLTCCISGDGLDQASKYVARLTPWLLSFLLRLCRALLGPRHAYSANVTSLLPNWFKKGFRALPKLLRAIRA